MHKFRSNPEQMLSQAHPDSPTSTIDTNLQSGSFYNLPIPPVETWNQGINQALVRVEAGNTRWPLWIWKSMFISWESSRESWAHVTIGKGLNVVIIHTNIAQVVKRIQLRKLITHFHWASWTCLILLPNPDPIIRLLFPVAFFSRILSHPWHMISSVSCPILLKNSVPIIFLRLPVPLFSRIMYQS